MISTWRWATVVSWLIGSSIGLGRGQAAAGLSEPRRRPGFVFGIAGAASPPDLGRRRLGAIAARVARARRPVARPSPAASATGRIRSLKCDPWSASSRTSITFSRDLRLPQEIDEPLVLQVSGDILQGPQVVTGLILGRDQQEEDIDRLAVQGREIDPAARQGDRADQPLERRMPGMRHRHPLADPRRAQLLAAEDGPDHALHVVVGQPAGAVEAADHLADRLLLAGGLQVHEDRLSYHEIQELHPPLHRRADRPRLAPCRPAPSPAQLRHHAATAPTGTAGTRVAGDRRDASAPGPSARPDLAEDRVRLLGRPPDLR